PGQKSRHGNQTKLNDGYAPDLMTERQKIRGCTIRHASPEISITGFLYSFINFPVSVLPSCL
ncbi:MAG TPA: hypothetical protein PK825_02840, partial [Bacteroidales bacterium]|nr:hypothetical protein [Bacteroidales bacterium]